MPNAQILTTVVGSYPVPDWLVNSPSEQALIDATRVVINTQETAGIDVVCDGELYRFDINHPETNGMIEYFVLPMGGIRNEITFDELIEYRKVEGMDFRKQPPGIVEQEISPGSLDLPYACRQAMKVATKPLKFTVTGPHMLAKTLVDKHYSDLPSLTMAIAETLAKQIAHLDAPVVQIDEANLPGHPQEWQWAAEAINIMLDQVQGTAAVHLCFGNYGGQTIQKGGWEDLIAYLNALHVDHIVMETRNRPPEELTVFKDLNPEIGLGLGVIDIKSNVVETAEEVARQIERAVSLLGPGRVTYVHPDCGFWMLKRSIADAKIRAVVEGRNLFEGI